MSRLKNPIDAPPQGIFEPGAADDAGPAADFAQEAVDESSSVELDLDAEPAASLFKRGLRAIHEHWKHAPMGPGVYRMIGENGAVLYVGKAKSLRRRVASYTRLTGHANRIARMIALTESMVFVSTRTEVEALLLEANLIKQLKPRFNVLLRDDKSFPYILLTKDERGAQLAKHRGARSRKGDYFGPFANVGAVNRTLNVLQRAFLLRSCENSFFDNRTRPCLLYQIKRCSGPCTGEVSAENYDELAREARDFLAGKSRAVRERLAEEMNAAAEELEFERAARLRDRIAALAAIQGQQGINPRTVAEADVFALHEEAGQFCVEAVFYRAFQNWGNRAYFPRADKSLSAGEVLGSFIGQFYAERPAPKLVLLSHAIDEAAWLAEALSERQEHRVEILVPQRGEKREMVVDAHNNAREALGRRLADSASQMKLLEALGAAFGMEKPPRRVEVYDNSHIMGSSAIGAMIVAGPLGFMKTHYRTFNIKGPVTPGDDYAMMREVLSRRFARLLKEAETPDASDPDAFPQAPDLILIDGGRGQYDAVRAVLDDLGVTGVTLAAIAKGADRNAGRESFFVAGREPFRLAPRDPALYFVQRLRDEAHRFAIGTHRARRKKEFAKNPLDEIAGVGPARKRALLQAFGTAKAVAAAALADLEKTPGLSAATAKLVFDHFHEKG
ncbi:excinuclease ABC subunit UvrC [Rhodoblastus acidophilus]|uniref:UvrABC system protein C n=1 Tax=Candidatus Rhodoblastus alkanivorans TaxID=2954117 RepID=A0ABS9Z549_9HYPH|nr:excinuclease ABC subunit UvrC [Candidatus Rhodoblastus alkanivorans]MCI4680252.1 excinuclease ABC subunit UvrC [Candidatus Rhodoblastus alkanivorans]MCI4682759.1 excinuclease ABC subunit UvrC [Candidatus Rhodoblastus alkanivorans]MDI4640066.1 excinuclease ABC subunit UvrC [Rhodoblastus acidophilus]